TGPPRWLAPRGVVVALVVGAGAVPASAMADAGDSLDGLPLPDRPTQVLQSDEPQHPGTATAVVVETGDSLWSIAADRAGPQDDPSQVAAAVQRWYATNASTIGPDPDLIHPGQQLIPPKEIDP